MGFYRWFSSLLLEVLKSFEQSGNVKNRTSRRHRVREGGRNEFCKIGFEIIRKAEESTTKIVFLTAETRQKSTFMWIWGEVLMRYIQRPFHEWLPSIVSMATEYFECLHKKMRMKWHLAVNRMDHQVSMETCSYPHVFCSVPSIRKRLQQSSLVNQSSVVNICTVTCISGYRRDSDW